MYQYYLDLLDLLLKPEFNDKPFLFPFNNIKLNYVNITIGSTENLSKMSKSGDISDIPGNLTKMSKSGDISDLHRNLAKMSVSAPKVKKTIS